MLHKPWPFIKRLNDNYEQLYNVNKHFDTDKSMVISKGRNSIK